jgi:hypothetical protein
VYSKAIYLLVAIHVRFASISPPPFPVPQIVNLPAAPTCFESSLLVHLGVIDLSQSPQLRALWPSPSSMGGLPQRPQSEDRPQEGGLEGTEEQAYLLRAAGVLATDAMVKKAQETGMETMPYSMLGWLQGVLQEDSNYKDITALMYQETNQF